MLYFSCIDLTSTAFPSMAGHRCRFEYLESRSLRAVDFHRLGLLSMLMTKDGAWRAELGVIIPW